MLIYINVYGVNDTVSGGDLDRFLAIFFTWTKFGNNDWSMEVEFYTLYPLFIR